MKGWLVFAVAGLLGCGGGIEAASVATLTSAQAAIRAAEEVGAEEEPRAALHLKHARDQLEAAEQLLEDGREEEAQRLLRRAEADAEVSVAVARMASTAEEAQEAEAELAAMRREAGEDGIE